MMGAILSFSETPYFAWFGLNERLRLCANQQERAALCARDGLVCIGEGKHKHVFQLNSEWVLKVGSVAAVSRDAYVWSLVSLPYSRFYAPTYFEDFLEIQRFGTPLVVGCDIWKLRKVAKHDGVWDIRVQNIRQFGPEAKIIDGRPKKWPL